jgi:hypothetical protein
MQTKTFVKPARRSFTSWVIEHPKVFGQFNHESLVSREVSRNIYGQRVLVKARAGKPGLEKFGLHLLTD